MPNIPRIHPRLIAHYELQLATISLCWNRRSIQECHRLPGSLLQAESPEGYLSMPGNNGRENYGIPAIQVALGGEEMQFISDWLNGG
jgi:hypothetical protein